MATIGVATKANERHICVAVTDFAWYQFISTASSIGLANFWTPGKVGFSALQPGEVFLFKLKSPNDYIVGGGKFVHFERLSLASAWEKFGKGNGAPTLNHFQMAVHNMRDNTHKPHDFQLGCIVLSDLFF